MRKKEILHFATTQMNLEVIVLNEMSNIKRQILYDLTYIWNQKDDTNELVYKTETDSQA